MRESGNGEKYYLNLINRKNLEISGVSNVDSFDEEEIYLQTYLGPLQIKGQGLHITQLNLEKGNICVMGFVDELKYLEDTGEKIKTKSKGLLQRILK